MTMYSFHQAKLKQPHIIVTNSKLALISGCCVKRAGPAEWGQNGALGRP